MSQPLSRRRRGNHVPRRTVLQGIGVTMALPWMESLAGFGSTETMAAAARAREVAGAPKRFAVVFQGNGINPNHWWAKGSGAAMELSQTLQPLEPLKAKINVIDGLFNKFATGNGIHPGMTGNLLTGAPLKRGAIMHSGISVDQLLANHIGQDTAQSSLVLACEEPMTGYHETNFSNAYGSHISWQNAESPMPNEMYPSLAFDSLFENRGNMRNISVLDRVKERAETLRRQIASTDRAKLDEYLSSVRDVERGVERLRVEKDKAEDRANGKPLLTMKRPDNGLPEDLRVHAQLMADIVAMAFQTDKTRVASLILARDLSALYYPFLDVREAHHGASHNDTSEGYERIARFHLSQFAYLAKRLDEMTEGEGTVLDNCCLLYLSNMFSGSKHDNTKVPLITAGGLGGALATGRTLNYADQDDDDRKLCSLYLGILDRMDVKVTAFGDADTRLALF
jgi:Protein of unknown function (DUF1552)